MEGLDRFWGDSQFVQDVGAPFLVGAAVGKLNRDEAVAFIELSGAVMLLKRVEPNWTWRCCYRLSQKRRADTLPNVSGVNVQLLDPTSAFLA
jgi:hypothetical protein